MKHVEGESLEDFLARPVPWWTRLGWRIGGLPTPRGGHLDDDLYAAREWIRSTALRVIGRPE